MLILSVVMTTMIKPVMSMMVETFMMTMVVAIMIMIVSNTDDDDDDGDDNRVVPTKDSRAKQLEAVWAFEST